MDDIFLSLKLNINPKIMVCNRQNKPKIIITLKGNRIERVNQYKYLESILSNGGRSKKEKEGA